MKLIGRQSGALSTFSVIAYMGGTRAPARERIFPLDIFHVIYDTRVPQALIG